MTNGDYKCTAPDHTSEATKWRKSLLSMGNRMHWASFFAVSSRHCAIFCFVAAMCIQWLTATNTAVITPERQVRLEMFTQRARQMRQKYISRFKRFQHIVSQGRWTPYSTCVCFHMLKHTPGICISMMHFCQVWECEHMTATFFWHTATCIASIMRTWYMLTWSMLTQSLCSLCSDIGVCNAYHTLGHASTSQNTGYICVLACNMQVYTGIFKRSEHFWMHRTQQYEDW